MIAELRSLRAPTRRAESGAVMVEFLIAYLPVLLAFLMFWQLSELLVAQMVVERASSAAGRAAIVVLPDDPAFYEAQGKAQYDGPRKREVRLAAGMMLSASPHLSENFTVDIQTPPPADATVADLTVEVKAEFRCKRLTWVCGSDGLTVLSATSQHTYHGAAYDYEPTDLSAVSVNSSTSSDPGCRDVGSGGTSNQGNGSGGSGNGSGSVPGKGSGGRSGNNGGAGGNSPDQSGSCPTGQSLQKDGTCARDKSGGLCDHGQHQDSQGRCVCADNSLPDRMTHMCLDGSGGSGGGNGGPSCVVVSGKRVCQDTCPPGQYEDDDGQCCDRSKMRKLNDGTGKVSCGPNPNCVTQSPGFKGGNQLSATFRNDGAVAKVPKFTAGLSPCTNGCTAGGNASQDVKDLEDDLLSDVRTDQFKDQCAAFAKSGKDIVANGLLKAWNLELENVSSSTPGIGQPTSQCRVECNAMQGKARPAKKTGLTPDLVKLCKAGGSSSLSTDQALKCGATKLSETNVASGTWPPGASSQFKAFFTGLDSFCKKTDPSTADVQAMLGTYNAVPGGSEQNKINSILNNTGNGHHTEPKLVNLLKKWATKNDASLQGGNLQITGSLSPCDMCDATLRKFAEDTNSTVRYCFDSIYSQSNILKKDPQAMRQFLQTPGSGWESGSIKAPGCVEYSGNKVTYTSNSDKLCAPGVAGRNP